MKIGSTHNTISHNIFPPLLIDFVSESLDNTFVDKHSINNSYFHVFIWRCYFSDVQKFHFRFKNFGRLISFGFKMKLTFQKYNEIEQEIESKTNINY